jgi:hypothetical protein
MADGVFHFLCEQRKQEVRGSKPRQFLAVFNNDESLLRLSLRIAIIDCWSRVRVSA